MPHQAHELYVCLRSISEGRDVISTTKILQELGNLHLASDMTMDEYLTRLSNGFEQLSCSGMAIDNARKVQHTLSGLPRQYLPYLMSIKRIKDLGFEDLTSDFCSTKASAAQARTID